jgi:hypothetical protein
LPLFRGIADAERWRLLALPLLFKHVRSRTTERVI